MEFISKPGDAFENSSEIIITLLNNKQLVCKIVNMNLYKDNKELELGLNVVNGKVVYKGVSDAFGLDYTPVSDVL